MSDKEALFEYLIRLGDNSLILSQRLGEWCGHGPLLEQDIALTNVALDLVGQARIILSYAGEVEGNGRSEDDLAFFRDEKEFRNNLLVEQPNSDFGATILRQYLFDVFQFYLYSSLSKSRDERLKAFAEKSLKEVTYHKKHSADWVLRLGDGTEESHQRMQSALDELWVYTDELFEMDEVDQILIEKGIAANPEEIRASWDKDVQSILTEASLSIPDTMGYMATGSRKGHHTEYLGYILAEMQIVPRSMPDAKW